MSDFEKIMCGISERTSFQNRCLGPDDNALLQLPRCVP